MQLLNSKGKITRKDIVDLLHITEPQAYMILTKLSKNGEIKLVGKGEVLHISNNNTRKTHACISVMLQAEYHAKL